MNIPFCGYGTAFLYRYIYTNDFFMKYGLLVFFSLLALLPVSAQVNDSAATVHAQYICRCIDTIDLQQQEVELRKSFNLCKTLSLANLLNRNMITPTDMTSEEQMGKLEEAAFEELGKNCSAVQRLVAAFRKLPRFKQQNDEQLFTPAAAFAAYQLKPGEANNRLHVYNHENIAEAKFQRLVDIRWTFDSEAEALKWHQMQLKENSEGGEPVKDMIIIQGAQELQVYREGKATTKMMEDFGIKQRHHYFLFVYKNIACKVFIATNDKTATLETVPFAMAAVKQLKAVVK